MTYYTAGEFAKRVGITSRTLRHYDTIGLLKPSGYTESGYRLYSEADMVRLQHILALRYLRFTLPEIQLALEKAGTTDVDQSLQKQKEAFMKEREHLDWIIRGIERLQESKSAGWEDMTELIKLISADEKVQKQFVEYWNRGGKQIKLFRECSANPETWRQFVFRQLEVQENERIFELDVNVGAMWRYNAARVPKCYIKQTALTESSIRYLRQRIEQVEWSATPEFDYEVIPAGKLNLTPDEYDVVFAGHLFIRSAEIDHVLESCRNILKQDGRFYCTAVSKDHMKELFQLVHRFEPTVHFFNMDSIGHFSYEVGAEVLERHFSNVQWHRYENHWQTDDVDTLFEAIWWTYSDVRIVLAGREEELQAFIKKEVAKNGPLHITDFAGVFSARKG